MSKPRKPHKPKLLGLTLTNAEYHGDTSRISKSGLDEINKSPMHYHYRYLDPLRKEEREKSWAKTGTAVGMAITEPDLFSSTYASVDDTDIVKKIGGSRARSTNEYKDWVAEQADKNAGKIVLPWDEYRECIQMRDAVRDNAAAKFLLKSGQAERSFYYTDPETGVKCRIRPDWLTTVAGGWICDVKTAADASPAAWSRSVAKFRYYVQDPFYCDGMKANDFEFQGFCFIVVEKNPPFPTGVYFLPKEATDLGRKEIRANLNTYAECLHKNKWPGYVDEKLIELNLPHWAYK